MTNACAVAAVAAFAGAGVVLTAQTPAPAPDPHRRVFALGDFRFGSGVALPNATLAYATFGTLNTRGDNAILVPSTHPATGQRSMSLLPLASV
jgi:homoserine acetyltransferase